MKIKTINNSENVFIRDESKLHKAPLWVLYWNMFSLIVIILLAITFMFTKNMILGVLLLVSILFDIYCDQRYIYQENLQVSTTNNADLTYSYNLNKQFVPSKNPQVRIIIKNITKVIIRNNIAIIYGDVEEKRPLVKTKKHNKIKINIKMETPTRTKELKAMLKSLDN